LPQLLADDDGVALSFDLGFGNGQGSAMAPQLRLMRFAECPDPRSRNAVQFMIDP
jgi:hypothetical protein